MNLPNLPTDNMYKFIALSGVFIFVVSMYLLTVPLNDNALKQLSYTNNIEKAKYESESTKIRLEGLEKRAENYVKAVDENRLSLESVRKLGDDLLKDSNKIDEEIDRVSALVPTDADIERLREETSQIYKTSYILSFIGGIMTYFGFYYWYNKLQKYQDEIIRNEAMKSRQVAKTKPKPVV